MADLKRWTEQELTRRDATDSGELFYFTLLADGLSPAELFCAPRFLVAFTDHREPLLPVSPAGTTG